MAIDFIDIKEINAHLKIVLYGKDNTGKSKFNERLKAIKYYCEFNKLKEYNPTFGVLYTTKIVKFHDKGFKLEIWDTAGHERFANLNRIVFRESDVVLIFYDSFNKQSFEKIKEFYKDNILENINKNCKYIVIRGKYDLKLENKEYVSDEEVLEFV